MSITSKASLDTDNCTFFNLWRLQFAASVVWRQQRNPLPSSLVNFPINSRFLGVRVASLCPTVHRVARDFTRRFAGEFSSVHMPGLLRRVERLIRTRTGDEVAIPLLLADEKEELARLGTMGNSNNDKFCYIILLLLLHRTALAKAAALAALKGDLVSDLGSAAGTIATVKGRLVGSLGTLGGVVAPIAAGLIG